MTSETPLPSGHRRCDRWGGRCDCSVAVVYGAIAALPPPTLRLLRVLLLLLPSTFLLLCLPMFLLVLQMMLLTVPRGWS